MDMIHLRVLSPPEHTAGVVARLSADEFVANLVVQPRTARHPDGDSVECDLVAGIADRVIADLRGLGADRHGSLMVEPIHLALSRSLDAQARERLGPLIGAPIWAEVEARLSSTARYPPSFFLFLVIAGVIGAVGLLTNSQILIVAAMIVGPEYGAITGVVLGMDRRDSTKILHGLRALAVGFTLATLAAWAFTLVVRAQDLIPPAFGIGVRPVAHLIDTPNFFSAVVATLAGIVGVVALTHTRTSTLLGVFVSVTTIPAASDIGVSVAVQSFSQALGSLEQLLLNVLLLIVVGFLTLRVQRAAWGRVSRRWARRKQTD